MSAATALVPVKELDAEQIALVKRTVAAGATDDELALFMYDCQRRGVHPLDRLLHFTKRNGKYTPITSIDFLRTRAHDTGKCAGISDPDFDGEAKKPGFAATVTVKRMVQGQLAEFVATARWDEYKPQQNDFMWTRMPFTMLGKCAEALALRKAFPQELAGLYTGDEMAQAGKPETHRETVNADTGEIIEEVERKAQPEPVADTELSYTGLLTSVTPRTLKGGTKVYDCIVDDQKVSAVATDLVEKANALAGQRVTVTYSTKVKGGLLLTSIMAEAPIAELTADDIPF
jgi:phage recombination protein Bet